MADRPLPAYDGDEPYVFVSYSHEDADQVYPAIRWLQDQGLNLWYDEGISGATRWRDAIAGRLSGCRLLLFFVSRNSVDSQVCREELEFALAENRPVLSVHLEPTNLPDGIKLAIANRQALHRRELEPEDYERKLLAAVATYLDRPIPIASHPIPRRRRLAPRTLGVVAALVFGAGALSLALILLVAAPEPHPERILRFSLPLPPGGATFSQSLSPDGKHIAVLSVVDGSTWILLRALETWDLHKLSGTQGAYNLFWSSDSGHIAFFARGKLKKISIDGGPAQDVCDVATFDGMTGTWGTDGVIIFAPSNKYQPGPLFYVSELGGNAEQLTTTQPGESHGFPTFLPDGKHFLYTRIGGPEPGIYLSSTADPTSSRLLADESSAHFAPPASNAEAGHLLFVRDRKLVAQPFDHKRLELTGTPFEALQRAPFADSGAAGISVSGSGTLAYFAGSNRATHTRFSWYDRSGNLLSHESHLDSVAPGGLSPDEKSLAVVRRPSPVGWRGDVWLRDLSRGIETRLTFRSDVDVASNVVWSPDGERVIYSANPRGAFDLFAKETGSSRDADLVVESANPKFPTDWSRDGRVVLFTEDDPQTRADLWYIPLAIEPDGSEVPRDPVAFLQTPFVESAGQLSPDGRWIAYVSNESGANAVYVRPFPTGESVWKISTEREGIQPRWRSDGQELFYLAEIGSDATLMSVRIRSSSPGSAFEFDVPEERFSKRINSFNPTYGSFFYSVSYSVSNSVSKDAERFLISHVEADDDGEQVVSVVTNWQNAFAASR